MAAHLSGSDSASAVSKIFVSMEYGPAPESDNVVNQWIADHGDRLGHFIDGKWYHPENRSTYDTKDPVTGNVIASTTQGTNDDIDTAVAAATKAHTTWSKISPHERAKYMYSIARHVQKHARLISVLESLDNGKTIRESRDADIPIVIRHFYHYAGWAQTMDTEMSEWKSIGVVGAIVPWNFPLMLLTWKLCPALAMGNTVVLKPATYTRLSALLMAEICAEAGLPPGVFNVVTGGGQMGSYLACHPDVRKVGFTGSTEVGKILRKATAGTGKKLSLELGGKSPVVVFDTADLDSAVEGLVDAIWFNQGQVCSAGSKCLVQDTVHDILVTKLKERLTHFRVGRSLDKCMDMGPIVDPSQMKSLHMYVDSAREEGAEVYQATSCMPEGQFFPPTLITKVQTVSRVVEEEIFGPVLVVLPFRTAKEAVSLANNTMYGLAGSVWSEKIGLALEVALSIKAGAIWINSHNLFDAAAGFGGYKQSGYGRDGGKEGLYEYVKPAWDNRDIYTNPDKLPSITNFGEFTQARPTIDSGQVELNGPRTVDRTYKMYYGGAQKRPDAPYSRPITAHATGHVIAHVGEGNRKDVRNAVESAHNAAPGWGKRAAYNRSQIVFYVAENLQIRREEIAARIAEMTGKTIPESTAEVDTSIDRLFHWAAYADKYGGTVQETTLYGATVKIHEPMGVIAAICPINSPLLGFVSLFAPAVIRGNCVVIVPSEKHPLVALDLYQMFETSDVSPGVLNILTGSADHLTKYLADHQDIESLWYLVFETSDVPPGVINILTGSADHLTKYLADHQDIEALWYFGGSLAASTYVEHASAENLKRTWVDYGIDRDWVKDGKGEEFLYQATQVKNVWIPMGDIYAN